MSLLFKTNFATCNGPLDEPLFKNDGLHAGSGGDRVIIQQDPLGLYGKVIRYRCDGNGRDTVFGTTNADRAEVLPNNGGNTSFHTGNEIVLATRILLKDYRSTSGDWNFVGFEIHDSSPGGTQSPVGSHVSSNNKFGERLWGGPVSSNGLTGTIRIDAPQVTWPNTQAWVSLVQRIKFSPDPNVGIFQCWLGGNLVYDYKTGTITDAHGGYLKLGMYRGTVALTSMYYTTDVGCFTTVSEANAFVGATGGGGGGPPPPPPPPPPPVATQLWPTTISTNSRYIRDQNGSPWMMVGDSPQCLINNVSLADMDVYFADRAAKGFNLVWVNMWVKAGLHGRADSSTYDGITPFTTPGDLSTPRETYFARVDGMMTRAKTNGITVLLDALDTHDSLAMLASNGQTKCFNYGVYLGNRYNVFPNLIWLFGNDFATYASDDQYLTKIADGIRSVDPNHLQTVELMQGGAGNSVASSVDATWDSRADLDSVYTYGPTYELCLTEYASAQTQGPTYMVEANYETENNEGGAPTTDETIRRQIYWTMLSGCTGHLYGHRALVFFEPLVTNAAWKQALATTAATQVKQSSDVFRARAWQNLVPDIAHTFCTAGYGTRTTTGDVLDGNYATAAVTPDGTLGMIYTPTSRTLTVDMTKMSAATNANWYDPRSGTTYPITGSPFANTGTRTFTTIGNHPDATGDWLLILETLTVAPPPPPTVDFDAEPADYLGGAYVVSTRGQHGSQADKQRCYKAVVQNSGTVTAMGTYREPQQAAGTETVQLAVWPDNGAGTDPGSGSPLGFTSQLSFESTSAVGRYSANVITPFDVLSGQIVWIGELSGGTGNIAFTRAASSGLFRLMDQPYTGGVVAWNTTTDSEFPLDLTTWMTGTLTSGQPPGNTTAPVITGSKLLGSTLTLTSIGQWTGPSPTFTYAWFRSNDQTRNSITFLNATGTTYVTQPADRGTYIYCRVRAESTLGFEFGYSNFIGAIFTVAVRPPDGHRVGGRTVRGTRRAGVGGGGI